MQKQILEKLTILEEHFVHSERPITLDEASEHLGLSKSYIYKLTHTNQIPFFKPMGKKLYFLKSELNKWMLRNKVKTHYELDQEAINYVQFGRDK